MGAGVPQNSDTLDSLPHGQELEWALQLHDGCSGQPDWESLLVSASYSVDGPEGCLRLESASSCLQGVAVDAVEVTPDVREMRVLKKSHGSGLFDRVAKCPIF